MASGWRVVGDLIRELIEDGLDDSVIKSQLRAEPSMRSRFLVLYDTVNILVQAGQNNFAVLASATRKCTSTPSPRTILRSRFTVTFTFLVRRPAIARSIKAQSGYTRLYGALPESYNQLFWDTTRTQRGGSCSRTFGEIESDLRAFASSHPLASPLAYDYRVVCQRLTFNTHPVLLSSRMA